MPRNIETLINEYDDRYHPLAAGIELRQLRPLARALSARLKPRQRLNFSVESLNALQPAAARYARQAARRRRPLTDEEHLRIVRELAAYLGSVFLRAVDGTWQNPGRLWLVAVVKEGSIVIVEDGQARRWSRWGVWVGQAAAHLWQAALSGKPHPLDLKTFRG